MTGAPSKALSETYGPLNDIVRTMRNEVEVLGTPTGEDCVVELGWDRLAIFSETCVRLLRGLADRHCDRKQNAFPFSQSVLDEFKEAVEIRMGELHILPTHKAYGRLQQALADLESLPLMEPRPNHRVRLGAQDNHPRH